MAAKKISATELRAIYRDYFVSKGHTPLPSSSLVAKDDPTLLFANSGMVQFKDVFLGKDKRPYTRATTCQKSLRVSGKHNDYDQIGRTARHHTFFEMLGNFSFGDYFKREAIGFAWELITEKLGMPKDYIWVSVHNSDEEAAKLWQEVTDIRPERIVKLGDDSNLWTMGAVGPCGYSSEIFYYIGDKPEQQSLEEFMKDDGTYLEFWNLVFMQFYRDAAGTQTLLPKPSVDTGMGLERMLSVLQGVKSNFDTTELRALISDVEKISGHAYDGRFPESAVSPQQWTRDVAMRVIVDHARAAAFLVSDGVNPGNERESYVLRRLIRRAVTRGQDLDLKEPFLSKVVDSVITQMTPEYRELEQQRSHIVGVIDQEERQFRKTLDSGLNKLRSYTSSLSKGGQLAGKDAFLLYDTFGFPLDLTTEVLAQSGHTVDIEGFEREMEGQRTRSRQGSSKQAAGALGDQFDRDLPATSFIGYTSLVGEGKVLGVSAIKIGKDGEGIGIITDRSPFYAEMGGQIGDKGTIRIGDRVVEIEDTKRLPGGQHVHIAKAVEGIGAELIGATAGLEVDRTQRERIQAHHSATHLVNAALRAVLGSHVEQRGSLVTADRLRFDFSHGSAISESQLGDIVHFIDQETRANYPVETEELPIAEARKKGAVAVFGEKYGDRVRVVQIGPNSVEFCGGTHVRRSGDIGLALLHGESSIASGIRRIEFAVGTQAMDELLEERRQVAALAAQLKCSQSDISNRVAALFDQVSELRTKVTAAQEAQAALLVESMKAKASSGPALVVQELSGVGRDVLTLVADHLVGQLSTAILVLGSPADKTVLIRVTPSMKDRASATGLVKKLAAANLGKGGGKDLAATFAVAKDRTMNEVFEVVRQELQM